MAERLRFRLPWLTPVTPRPAPQPQPPRPTADPQPPVRPAEVPARPSTNVPVQRPPFRPAGIAPVQPAAPQPQAPKQAESTPTSSASATETNGTPQTTPPLQAPTTEPTPTPRSPTRPATESRVASQPSSPVRTAPQPRPASLPPSPSRNGNARQPQSPSRSASQRAGQTPSLPPSPTRRASTVQPTPPRPRSPIPISQPTAEEAKQFPPPSVSAPPQLSAPDQGEKPQAAPDVPTESPKEGGPAQPVDTEIAATVLPPRPRSPISNLQPTAEETAQLPPPSVSAPPLSSAPDQGEKQEATPEVPAESLKQEEPAQPSQPEKAATSAPAASVSDSEVGADLPATVSEAVKDTKEDQKFEEVPTKEDKKFEEEPTKEDQQVEEERMKEGKKTRFTVDDRERESGGDTRPLAAAPESIMPAQTLPSEVSRSEEKPQERKDTRGRKKHPSGVHGEHVRIVKSTSLKATHLASGSQQNHMMFTGEQAPLQKEIKDDISNFVRKLGTELPNQPGETPVSVVTLAGENRGASMHLGSEPPSKDGPIHIYRGYKSNPDDSTGGTTTDAEENWQDKRSEGPATQEELPIRAYINSNAQSINNSILLGSSINEGSTGVRMAYSYTAAEQPPSSSKQPAPTAHRAQFNVTRAEKLTHEPTVRRRCLRGLFLEPSDSDPDNPEKPRRHGCRYACSDKGTDKDIGIL